LRAVAAVQLNGRVAEMVAGLLQSMVGHMVVTRLPPLALSRQAMHSVSVEQESQVPAVVAAATGVAKVVRNMVAVVAVQVGRRMTLSLSNTLRGIAVETAN
jgi:hypothetical protein